MEISNLESLPSLSFNENKFIESKTNDNVEEKQMDISLSFNFNLENSEEEEQDVFTTVMKHKRK